MFVLYISNYVLCLLYPVQHFANFVWKKCYINKNSLTYFVAVYLSVAIYVQSKIDYMALVLCVDT